MELRAFLRWVLRDAREYQSRTSEPGVRGDLSRGEIAPKKKGRRFPGAPLVESDLCPAYFWMQVSTVSLVHSSRPVKTGSSTFLPSIRSIMTDGAL